uniref:Transmembrane protein n=1 Tax=Rhizophagus irregularis (strain DAOM 181602 / DAOM 197198 / MUCL 43194) TaxID=747089 RepID=U9UNZ8_RHIID
MRWRISAVEFRSVDLFDLRMKRSWLELNWTGRLDSSAILTRGNKFLTVRLLSFISLGMGFLGLPILFGNRNVSVSCGNRGLVYVHRGISVDRILKVLATGSLKNTDCSSGICCMGIRESFSLIVLASTSKKDEEWWRNERLWECKVTARRKEKREETWLKGKRGVFK